MSNAFFGIQMANRTLNAMQTAMNITGHNVANMNTKGYSRQRVTMATNPSIIEGDIYKYQLGSGIHISTINRVRDNFLEQRYRGITSDQSMLNTMKEQLNHVESLFNEPNGSGMSDLLDNFYAAFQQLSTNPGSSSLRLQARTASENLTQGFRELNRQLNQMDSDLTTLFNSKMEDVKSITETIAHLNIEIQKSNATGAAAPDLSDKRDSAILELAKLIDIDVREGENGAVNIFSGEAVLVWNDTAKPLPTTLNLAIPQLSAASGDSPRVPLYSGELGAIAHVRQRISDYLGQLDNLANNLITNVNVIHSNGYTPSNTTGINFFTGTNSATIDLSAEIKNSIDNMALAGGPPPVSAGDNAQAIAIANLKSATSPALNGMTANQYYANLLSTVGQDAMFTSDELDTQNALLSQLDALRESVSGVNLDEEMIQMMQYQRSYQASAKLVTIFDDIIRETIERLGR